MSNRDEFLSNTKDALCKRVGGRCSFPSCRAPTSGPSDESGDAIDSTGMACHIYAAAAGKGAKRFDPDMTSEQRRSVENGIWMCYRHGKQIDNDECRFTSDILFKWKEIAEKCAQIEHELGRSLNDNEMPHLNIGLADYSISIVGRDGAENQIIGEALRDAGVVQIWGVRITSYLRDYLIERTRNAFQHGGASNVRLEIAAKKITLIDDGDDFTYNELLKSTQGRGGKTSKENLLKEYAHRVLSVSRRLDGKNHSVFSLIDNVKTITEVTPCTVELSYRMESGKNFNLDILESCSHLYVTLPEFFSTSDLYWLRTVMPAMQNDLSRLVFVINNVADYIPKELSRLYPESRVMDLTK